MIFPFQDLSETTRIGLVQFDKTILFSNNQLFGRILIWLRCVIDFTLPNLHHKVHGCFLYQLFIGIEGF